MSKDDERQELDPDEVDAQEAEELPDREVMSIMHPGPNPLPIEPLPPETL